MGKSLGLAAYLAASSRSETLALRVLRHRVASGKEDSSRTGERFGRAGIVRPDGQIAWLHSASVGEVLSILDLVRILGERRPQLSFLLTTGTLSSAKLLQRRMPRRTVHQFIPYDLRPAIAKFLDHWRPSVGILTESELWPALICETHDRHIPLLFVNARMSRSSYHRWRWVPGIAASLLRRFEGALVQDDCTARYLSRLGFPRDRMEVLGSLKGAADNLPLDKEAHDQFLKAISGRPMWLAASTHEGEDEIVAAAHRLLLERERQLLLAVVPRHPERGVGIAELFRQAGFSVKLRSRGELPEAGDQVYVADTLGELGVWYRVSSVCFLGGSLVDVGGHNPYEPAFLKSAIVHGPHVKNFASEFERLARANGATMVESCHDLAMAIKYSLNGGEAVEMSGRAFRALARSKDVTVRAAEAILSHLPEPQPN